MIVNIINHRNTHTKIPNFCQITTTAYLKIIDEYVYKSDNSGTME